MRPWRGTRGHAWAGQGVGRSALLPLHRSADTRNDAQAECCQASPSHLIGHVGHLMAEVAAAAKSAAAIEVVLAQDPAGGQRFEMVMWERRSNGSAQRSAATFRAP